jgi:phosphoenolpyruvate carboxykinase (GTP)
MKTIARDTIFTNVALTKDGDAWWEDKDKEAPEGLTDWKGNPNWKPSEATPRAAHPNSRFCVPITNCPNLDSEWDNPKGVPIDAIIFGGRRSTTIPLVYESLDWNHGVFIGSSISSETTAANVGDRGTLRNDPFAMLPFCGYNMGDYFDHWLKIGKHKGAKLPKIFGVNWFRKENNKFLWPGFGENSRVIKWIFERCDDPHKKTEQKSDNAVITPIGYMPRVNDIDVKGLDISQKNLEDLLSVDSKGWMKDIENLRNYYGTFGKSIPKKLMNELNAISERLEKH